VTDERPSAETDPRDDSIVPAGVPRSSLARKLVVLALLGGAGGAAYVERAWLLPRIAPLITAVGLKVPAARP